MSIFINTSLTISAHRHKQEQEILPVLLELSKRGLYNLFCERNKEGKLVIICEDETMQRRRLLENDTQAGLHKFTDTYFSNLPFTVTSINRSVAKIYQEDISKLIITACGRMYIHTLPAR